MTAVDRDGAALAPLAPCAEIVVADLEAEGWPFADRTFDAVVVTNYLWRPLSARLRSALAPGGVLIHETFASGQETVGRPARRQFLLARGELLRAAAGLSVVAYEDGVLDDPERFVQRIVAVRDDGVAASRRHRLMSPAARTGSLESNAP